MLTIEYRSNWMRWPWDYIGRYVLWKFLEAFPWIANSETGLTAVSLFLIYRSNDRAFIFRGTEANLIIPLVVTSAGTRTNFRNTERSLKKPLVVRSEKNFRSTEQYLSKALVVSTASPHFTLVVSEQVKEIFSGSLRWCGDRVINFSGMKKMDFE